MYKYPNRKTHEKSDPPPFNMTIYKGYRENVISRSTAMFLTQTKLAKDFVSWLKTASCPEEYYFATMSRVFQEIYYQNGSVIQGKTEKQNEMQLYNLIFLFQITAQTLIEVGQTHLQDIVIGFDMKKRLVVARLVTKVKHFQRLLVI